MPEPEPKTKSLYEIMQEKLEKKSEPAADGSTKSLKSAKVKIDKPVIPKPIEPIEKTIPKPKKEPKPKSKCGYCGKMVVNLNRHLVNCPDRPGAEPKGIFISFADLEKIQPYTRLRFTAALLGIASGSGKNKKRLKSEIKIDIQNTSEKAIQSLDLL